MAAEPTLAEMAASTGTTRPPPEHPIQTLPNPFGKDPNFGRVDPKESNPDDGLPTLAGDAGNRGGQEKFASDRTACDNGENSVPRLGTGIWPRPTANADGTLPFPFRPDGSLAIPLPKGGSKISIIDDLASSGKLAIIDMLPPDFPTEGPGFPTIPPGMGPYVDKDGKPVYPDLVPPPGSPGFPTIPPGMGPYVDRSLIVIGNGSGTVFQRTMASGSNTVYITNDSGTVVLSEDSGAIVVFNPAQTTTESTPPEPAAEGTLPFNEDPNSGIVDPDKPESRSDPATLLRDAKPAGLRMIWRDNGTEVRRLEMTDGTWPLVVANADGTLPIPMAKKTSRISILKNPDSSGQTIYFDTVAYADGQHSGLGGGSATAEVGKVIQEEVPPVSSAIPKPTGGPGPRPDDGELPKGPPDVPSALPDVLGGTLPPQTEGKSTTIKFGSGSNTVIHSMGSGGPVVVGSGAIVVFHPTALGKGGESPTISIQHPRASGAGTILFQPAVLHPTAPEKGGEVASTSVHLWRANGATTVIFHPTSADSGKVEPGGTGTV